MGRSLLFVLLSTFARATTALAATGDTGLTGGTSVAPTGETGLVDTGTTGSTSSGTTPPETTPPETTPPGTTPSGTPTESASTGDTGLGALSDTAAPIDPSLVVTASSLAGEEGGVGCDHGARRSFGALGVLVCSLPWLIRRREA